MITRIDDDTIHADNVLSLFDGISCGQIALGRAGITCGKYMASEIDSNATRVTNKHFPSTVQVGDVRAIDTSKLPPVDILMGGSPCQSFSMSGKMEGFDGKSGLFFEFLRVKNETNPTFWLLENVKMKGEWRDIISGYLGVEPILINSNRLSGQNRPRYYWTNIPCIPQPVDAGVYMKDIVLDDSDGVTLTGRPGQRKPVPSAGNR